MTSTRRALLYLMAVGACALQALAQSPPIADAGVDLRATIGQEVTLDGRLSSDPDDRVLSYWWSFEMLPDGSGATMSDPTAATPAFTVDLPGDYVLSLVVNNGELDSAPDFIIVSVFNNPPVADAGPALFPRVGEAVMLDGTLSFDPDFDRLSYQWSFRLKPDCSRAILSTATSDTAGFVADCPGTYTVQLSVDDGIATSSASAIVQTVNSQPVANAGPDHAAAVGHPVHLNGSGSSDLDGSPLTYSWALLTRPAGSLAALSGAQTAFPTFTPDRPGGYRLRLVVNDGVFNSVSDIVAISTANTAPVADAGRDARRSVGEVARLDGTSSTDVDGQPLRYTWSLITRPPESFTALDNPSSIRPLLFIDAPGTYVARLTVNDGFVSSVADTVRISTTNAAPVADAGPDILAERGRMVQLNGSRSTDVDGDDVGFRWALVSKPTGSATILFNVAAVRPALVPDLAGDYIVQLVATDGRAISAPDSIVITTRNVAPTADAGPDQSIQVDLAALLDGTGSRDANNDALTYRWTLVSRPLGSNAGVQIGVPITSLMPDMAGIYVVSLEVSDGIVTSAPDTVVISTPQFNSVPVARPQRAEGEGDVEIGTAVTLDGLGSSDADFNFLTARWSLIIRPRNSRAEFSDPASPTPVVTPDVVGTYVAQLIVTDGLDHSPPATLVLIAVPRRNHPPIADAGENQFAIPFQLVQLDGRGSDDPDPGDRDRLKFAWTLTMPGDCTSPSTLDDRTSATPTFTPFCTGDYIATLIVGDGQLSSLPSNVTIVVRWPVVTIEASDSPASEAGPDARRFVVTRTGSVERDLFVMYAIEGTAQNSVDYEPIAAPLLIPAAQATATIVIVPIPDDLVEGDETVVVTLIDGPDYDIQSPVSATVTIHDDDQPSVSIGNAFVAEGNGEPVIATFEVTLNSRSTDDVTVDFATEDGTAIGGPPPPVACPAIVPVPDDCFPDFVHTTGTITFEPGQTSATIEIPITGDTRFELEETFRIVLSGPTNATILDGDAIGTIFDDDPQPALSIAPESLAEGDAGSELLVFSVTQSDVSGLPTTVEVATADASATAPGDYVAVALTVEIPAGALSASVPVAIVGDTVFEPHEEFVVRLANPINASLLVAEAIGTIENDDNAAVVTIEATDSDAHEAGEPASFTFTREGDMTATLSVSFTVGGTATNGEDFSLIASPVIIHPDETSVTVLVNPLDDGLVEDPETVVLRLESGVNYHVGPPGTATVTIIDNDTVGGAISVDPLTLDFGDVPVGTSSPPQRVTVTNIGATRVTMGAVTRTPSDYQLTDACSGQPLDPGEHCTVDVVLTPAATIDFSGELRIESDAPGSPHVVTLSGRSLLFCGQTFAGTITAAGQSHEYQFTANAGDAVSIGTVGIGVGLFMTAELRAPDRGLLKTTTGTNTRLDSGPLPETGIYTIVVHDNNLIDTGGYNINLQFTTGQCAATIGCGETQTGVFPTPNPWGRQATYRFAANAGDGVVIAAVGVGAGFFMVSELRAPDGHLVKMSTGVNTRLDSGPLPETGTYTIVVYDNNLIDGGQFNVDLQFTAGQCATPIACGQSQSGAFAAPNPWGRQAAYRFDANTGDAVTVTAAGSGIGFFMVSELRAPDGRLFKMSTGVNTHLDSGSLPEDGTYTILVYDNNLIDGGTYTVTYELVGGCTTPTASIETFEARDIAIEAELNPAAMLTPRRPRVRDKR